MKGSSRCRQLVRTWNLLVALRRRAHTIHELAELFAVTTRTIRRDLEALQLAGFPLYDDAGDWDGDAKCWKLDVLEDWPDDAVIPTQERHARLA